MNLCNDKCIFITLSEPSPCGEQYNVLTVKQEPTPLHYSVNPNILILFLMLYYWEIITTYWVL